MISLDHHYTMLLPKFHDLLNHLPAFRSPVHIISKENQFILIEVNMHLTKQRIEFIITAMNITNDTSAHVNLSSP
ncbi:hypothetical protein D3C76_1286580 [compost metagenome]